MRDMVFVLNFDGLSSRSIARKLRAERFFCKIVPGNVSVEEVKSQAPLGLILAGGSTGERLKMDFDPQLLLLGVPVLALGDAAPALLNQLGGKAAPETLSRQVATVTYDDSRLFAQLEPGERLLCGVHPLLLSETLVPCAQTGDTAIGFRHQELPVFGLQLQIEQNDTDGMQILVNFAQDVCGCTAWWDNDAFVERAVEEIRRIVGEGTAVCALSGGVDSGVCALLGHMAIGARLKCIFVDTGLLRKNEVQAVLGFYRDTMGLNIRCVDARERFLTAIAGVTGAAQKQEIIARLLEEILEEEVQATSGADVLLHGTNYNDRMQENGAAVFAAGFASGKAVMVEPVRELFKDEIRRIAEDLGLPPNIITRQPFPDSGLALRILSDVTNEKLDILREADAIFRDEVEKSGQGKRLWQHFAILSANPADGKMVVLLRAVHASEGAMAMAARLSYDLLERVVDRILREVPKVSRVVYDLTPSNNYEGIEWR